MKVQKKPLVANARGTSKPRPLQDFSDEELSAMQYVSLKNQLVDKNGMIRNPWSGRKIYWDDLANSLKR